MRFKKGSKVEVLCKRGLPLVSWRCAEIICWNGHNYTVRYFGCEDFLERISRREIRPCPPPLPEISTNWAPGDVVEVFDNFSWKMATISKVLGKKYVLVRLLESSVEFEAFKFDVRARQFWQDDKWVMIRLGSVSWHDENLTVKNIKNSVNHVQKTKRKGHALAEDDYRRVMYKEKFSESNIAYSKALKRGPYGHSHFEAYDDAIQKRRAIEKGGRLHPVLATYHSPHEQIDSATFIKDITGENCIYSSFHNQNGVPKLGEESRKRTGTIRYSLSKDMERQDTNSVSCSVGSCSINSKDFYMLHHATGLVEDIDGDCSDAESFYQPEYEERNSLLPSKEELAAKIHRLELHAYRCTMEALHACGPLSWEQEALVTNLRLSLHISNDEHLMEVRNLVSGDNNIPSR